MHARLTSYTPPRTRCGFPTPRPPRREVHARYPIQLANSMYWRGLSPRVDNKVHVGPFMPTSVHDLLGRSPRGVRSGSMPAVMPWRKGHPHDANTERGNTRITLPWHMLYRKGHRAWPGDVMASRAGSPGVSSHGQLAPVPMDATSTGRWNSIAWQWHPVPGSPQESSHGQLP